MKFYKNKTHPNTIQGPRLVSYFPIVFYNFETIIFIKSRFDIEHAQYFDRILNIDIKELTKAATKENGPC